MRKKETRMTMLRTAEKRTELSLVEFLLNVVLDRILNYYRKYFSAIY